MRATHDFYLFVLASLIALVACVSGCQQKETLLDVDTPNGGVEIQRDKDGGNVTVEIGE
ncbi:hypothetical protein Mal15_47100 [Stieleria maiorica]|uniref:Uncharacterized protein n=1 Tax=Stieleria maiorica TaxID=2795974 RepID=A0A5B9MHN6_9BACT|nr:hypothetical protein [Stieleria maiorica]QEG00639.1 hypothetical protein Mal15_47100 [Stieleria maiorica]